MEPIRFLQACNTVMSTERKTGGIGTLGEKTLHAALKFYFEPNGENHEIRFGSYVADIYNKTGFIEIQTRQFFRLRDKLELFLKNASVTVVYPVPALKWISWIDKDGIISPRRKSPKQAQACEILPEIYRIKNLLNNRNLHFCITMLEVEDYRLKNGWSNDGKKGSTRFDRIPISLLDEIYINGFNDYNQLIPQSLDAEFSVKEFSKHSRLSPSKATAAVNVLYTVGAIERVGKEKNAYIYKRKYG